MVSTPILHMLQHLASLSPYKEICGLIDSAEAIYPIENMSGVASDFVFSRSGYGKALNAIQEKGRTVWCVYHSHLDNDPLPSIHDLVSMKRCGLDYLIVVPNNYTYNEVEND